MNSISIIIPIYNEELLLKKAINNLIKSLNKITNLKKYEILLIENGSKDKTYLIANRLKIKYQKIKILRLKDACYGEALKLGIINARYNNIFQFDLDLIDINFLKKALKLLKRFDIIIGSKLHPLSKDKHLRFRIMISILINFFLKKIFNYNISDTHGIKAYKKKKILKFLKNNIVFHHFFDTELVLRALKSGLRIVELPINLKEIRPTRFSHRTRFLQIIKELYLLIKNRRKINI